MRILFINKFLYPNGGSETYMFKLGEYLQAQGHDVQYFGMDHEERCVGNRINSYTSKMDFQKDSKLAKFKYGIKTIYSREARRKLREVLDDFQADVCHLNNFNFQLTPSVILEIKKWRAQSHHKCCIIYTAHDYQLICPNHSCRNPVTRKNCEKCLPGFFYNCIKNKCIHGSRIKSIIGAAEAYFWKANGVYRYIDTIICCSEFLKRKIDSNPILASKTVVVPHFISSREYEISRKEEYVLYFGRYSEEKGIRTLLQVCHELPEIQFVFAGKGPLKEELKNIPNINDIGFQSGEILKQTIQKAQFTILPSECYETFGLSIIESISLGTPVIGANIGGIPEVIQDGYIGELFKSGEKEDLKHHIRLLWRDRNKVEEYSRNCLKYSLFTIEKYYEQILKIYQGNVYEQ